MEQQPGTQSAPADASSVPIQPDQVPETWLLDEAVNLADNVDRLAGDLDLVTSLALGGYRGHDWDVFATELARYGMAVIGGWMSRGLIFARCRDRGFGGLPQLDRRFDPDEIEELVGETVAKALHHFRDDVLMKSKWDSRRGATLRTFFIGQCLIRFANIYRRWWGSEQRQRFTTATDDNRLLADLAPRSPGVDVAAVDAALVASVFPTVKDLRVRKAMILTAAGRTQREIADILDVTEKTVERMLANEHKRQQRRVG